MYIQNCEPLAFPITLCFLKRVHILPEESFNKNFIVFKFFVKTEGVSILLNSRNGIVRVFLADYIMNNK